MDLWAFDIRRFGPHHAGTRYLHARAVESYGRYYKIHWPAEEMQTGRGARRSPLYGALKDKGAVFGSKFGWERPNWFAPADYALSDAELNKADTLLNDNHSPALEDGRIVEKNSFRRSNYH